MSFLKKQSAGTIATCITLVCALISCIIYAVNLGAAGYFNKASVPSATVYVVIAIVLLIVVIALAQLKTDGTVGILTTIVADAARIIIPALFVAAAITFVSARVQGFAFIYFSNEEVLQEVQTAANLSSSQGAIVHIVVLVVTALIGMISAFFSLKKKEA